MNPGGAFSNELGVKALEKTTRAHLALHHDRFMLRCLWLCVATCRLHKPGLINFLVQSNYRILSRHISAFGKIW